MLSNLKLNIKKNAKKLNAIMADILIAIITAILYGITAKLELTIVLILVVFTIKPYIFSYISIMFKGELADIAESHKENINIINEENARLKQQLANQLELSEYKIKIASMQSNVEKAVIGNKEFNDTNKKIGDL